MPARNSVAPPLVVPPLDLFPVTLVASDWEDAERKFFAENGIIDTIIHPAPALRAAAR